MVIYNNKTWLNAVVNFYRSYVMRVIVRACLAMGVYATVFCLVIDQFNLEINFVSGVFSWLGIVLSILLVFRTNTAYDRWWEGRKQWGSLVNTSRSLSEMIHSLVAMDDRVNRAFYAKHIANFSAALVEHLRDGVKIEKLHYLDASEIIAYRARQHIPNYISGQLYDRSQTLYRDGFISGYDILPVKQHIQILIDILGACERIKKTPIPFSYSVYIKTFVLAYCLILPFGLVEEFGYFTIPMMMLIGFAFVGVELMAEEIEDPFGVDCNDLPTGTIADTIKRNVYEILLPTVESTLEPQTVLYEKIH